MQIDRIMRDLLARIDALDKGLAQQRKQQQNRGRARLLQDEEEGRLAQQKRVTVGPTSSSPQPQEAV